jgi:hypothetical protein
MTRTEERLFDALLAKAGAVRDDELRPLAEPRPRANRPAARRARRSSQGNRGRRGWLAPLASAVAVMLVAVLAVTLTSSQPSTSSGPAQTSAAVPASRPPFFTEQVHQLLEVRSVANGKLIGQLSLAKFLQSGGEADLWGITAAPDGRTFYLIYAPFSRTGAPVQPLIYSFRVTANDTVTPMRLVARGPAGGPGGGSSVAVSPDGAELALAMHIPGSYYSNADTIVVFDLHTGAYHQWRGGLRGYVHTEGLTIGDLSWSGPSTVDFVASWCSNGEWLYCGSGTAQVRALNLGTGGGGGLKGTTVLVDLGRYPDVSAVIADQQGHIALMQVSGRTLTAIQRKPTEITIDQVSAANGAVVKVLYRHTFPFNPNLLGPMIGDPSGQYLMVWYSPPSSGWLRNGAFHKLPANLPYPNPYGFAW